MITIKDYAKETGVTYEAVRQRIKRYQEDLNGHIHRQGRTQYLDDVAVAFLNEHRLQEPTVLYDKGAGDAFRELQQEREDLRAENKELLQELRGVYKELRELEQFKLEAEKEKRLLAASKETQEARERELDQREANIAEEVKMAVQEATDAQKTVLDKQRDLDVEKARKEAQKAAEDKAYLQYHPEIAARDEKIRELEKYAAACKARDEFFALPWFKRIGKKAPTVPELKEG